MGLVTLALSVCTVLLLVFLLLTVRRSLLRFLFLTKSDERLDFATHRLRAHERVLLFFIIASKAIKGPKLRHTATGFDLPRIQLACPVQLTASDRRLYSKAAQLASSRRTEDEESPFLLAAVTNSMMVMLLAHPKCPVNPLGAVNVKNRFEFYRAVPQSGSMTAKAIFGGTQGRRTKRGIEFDVVIKVTNEAQLIMKQIITVMKPLPRSTLPRTPPQEPTVAKDEHKQDQPTVIDKISFPSHAPDLWAQLCGDYNPIHVSSLAAKLFGFPGKILHGNHAVASLLAESRSLPSVAQVQQQKAGWRLEVQFRRPMVLPLRSKRFELRPEGDTVHWKLCDSQKEYVTGTIGPL